VIKSFVTNPMLVVEHKDGQNGEEIPGSIHQT
jgi:hypothetical protein